MRIRMRPYAGAGGRVGFRVAHDIRVYRRDFTTGAA
jgi:hypothetical protein